MTLRPEFDMFWTSKKSLSFSALWTIVKLNEKKRPKRGLIKFPHLCVYVLKTKTFWRIFQYKFTIWRSVRRSSYTRILANKKCSVFYISDSFLKGIWNWTQYYFSHLQIQYVQFPNILMGQKKELFLLAVFSSNLPTEHHM